MIVPQASHVAPFARFTRWQSTGTPASGLTTLRALVYGMSTAGLVVGGSLVYASYNPSFRNKANEYVPGFARLADFAAGIWVGVSDAIKQKTAGKVGMKKDLGSKLDSNPKENAAQILAPSVVVSEEEKPESKELYAIETSDKDKSVLKLVKEGVLLEATTDKEAGAPPPSLSTEESTGAATKCTNRLADGVGIQQSSQHIKEEKEDEKLMIVEKVVGSQPEMLSEVVSRIMLRNYVCALKNINYYLSIGCCSSRVNCSSGLKFFCGAWCFNGGSCSLSERSDC